MLNFTSSTRYYLCDKPTDMRKGRNGLACIVREVLHRAPLDYGAAFIFYSKRYDMVKILHWDLNGYTMLVKWFEDGKLLKPVFMKAQSCHQIDREQLILLLSTSVQTKIIL